MAQLTYLLHGAVLLEKLNGFQLVKEFPTFYRTQSFITTFISLPNTKPIINEDWSVYYKAGYRINLGLEYNIFRTPDLIGGFSLKTKQHLSQNTMCSLASGICHWLA